MCVGMWTLDHPNYALILCTNRDEFLNRPTEDAHFHSFEDENDHQKPSLFPGSVLSGRDIQAGGSWFGISRTGRVALLTNITETPQKLPSSRGYLVSSFLLSDSSHPLEDEVGKIIPQDAEFAGFNLLLLAPTPLPTSKVPLESENKEAQGPEPEPEPEPKSATASGISRDGKLTYDAVLVTNYGAGGTLEARRLTSAERACGCMSNGIDGQGGNEWPKVKRARKDLGEVLKTLPADTDGYSFAQTEKQLIEHLFRILTWQSPDPVTQRSELRHTVHVDPFLLFLFPSMTKVPETSQSEGLRASSSTPLATNPNSSDPQHQYPPPASSGSQPYYGTRLSTVLLVRNDGSVLFIERDIWKLGKDGQPKRIDKQERRGEGGIKERVFKFNLPSVTIT